MAQSNGRRDRWDSRTAFVLAAIGSAVGLGNIWRFPYICYSNGGGAFFIPYLVALFTAGIPLLILEFGIGQMMQGSAPVALRKTNRHSEWVGWFALLVSTIIGVYYAVIMAWCVEYLVYAFRGFFTHGAMPWTAFPRGEEAFFTEKIRRQFTAAGELWQYHWPIILGLAATWIGVFFVIAFGVKGIGKVVRWTVPIKIVVLAILIVRGLTLPGAAEGIRYFLTPNMAALTQAKTWLAAYGQIFFSLTIGFGVMIAYASYLPRDADVANNAFITGLGNCSVSFLAGFAVFSVVGYLALQKGVPVTEVASQSLGLVFVTYPTAVSKMGELGWLFPPVIGVLFFVMLLSLGIDSLFSLVEAVVSALRDRFPWLTQGLLAALYCLFSLGVGILFFAGRAGINWLDCFDHWANDYGLAIVGLLQCLIVGYFF
ncbi:MAG: sodium-dependent transporter, partial [Planctomycetota bacterium]